MHKNSPIGMLDSGIGGLTIAKALSTLLPNEQIIYFGDTQNFPYGDKTNKELKTCISKVIAQLMTHNCKMIIFACNTAYAATHNCLKSLVKKDIIIVNVIDPLIDFICNDLKREKIGLLGTKKTVNSNIYNKIGKNYLKKDIINIATPSFAPMVENNTIDDTEIERCVKNSKLKGIDQLILGCTHYYYIEKNIKKYLDSNVKIIEASEIVAKAAKKILKEKNLISDNKIKNNIFLASKITENFKNKVKSFFPDVERIELCNCG